MTAPADAVPEPKPTFWRRASGPLRILAALAILGALVGTGRLDLGALMRLRLGPGLVALVLVAGGALLATSLRWVCVVRAWGGVGDFGKLLGVGLSSNVLTFISPAGAGTDAARAVYLSRSTPSTAVQAGTIAVADRYVGLQTLLIAAAVACWVSIAPTGRLIFPLALTGAAAAAVLLPVLMHRFAAWLPLKGKLAAVRDGAVAVTRPAQMRWLLCAYGCALVAAVANGVLPLLGLMSLTGSHADFGLAGASFLVVVVNAIAPTPGGLGFGEAAASGLMHAATAGPSLLVVRTASIVWALLFGVATLIDASRPVRTSSAFNPAGTMIKTETESLSNHG